MRSRRITYTIAYNAETKLGTLLYSDSELFRACESTSVVTRVFESQSCKNKSTFFYQLFIKYFKHSI